MSIKSGFVSSLLAIALATTLPAMAAEHGHGAAENSPTAGQTGPGQMGQGMMGPGMMGPGMMNMMMGRSGMMGSGQMGQGTMGPGMMGGQMGPGMATMMMGLGNRVVPIRDIGAEDVRHFLIHRIEIQGYARLRVGKIEEASDEIILAEIQTVDGALVQRLEIDRHTGEMREVN